MDERKPLDEHSILNFPVMPCTVKTLLGKGSNAIVYTGEYPDLEQPSLKHQVLIKELFPFQERGLIAREPDGSIRCDPTAWEEMTLHRLSFQRASQVHLALKQAHPSLVDENINTFSLNNTLYTVLGFSGGRTLEADMARTGSGMQSLLLLAKRLQKILLELELFHASGFLHLDISPDNILLIGNGKRERISIIDYNSVHTLEEIRQKRDVYFSAKKGYTAAEVLKGRRSKINVQADLYSVAAVFFYGLMNRTLTEYERVDAQFKDLSESICLKNQPASVISMVRTILQKGLCPVPRHRYASAEQMRIDVEELIDRIEGRGITHWALWEAGYSEVRQMIRQNPAYHYLQDADALYPVLFQNDQQETFALKQMLGILYGGHERLLYLDGMGGIGKTTTLLRMILYQTNRYLSDAPAFLYISLFNWNQSGTDYIRKRILENLRFKPETDSFQAANHELDGLLSEPFYTGSGERPKAILFLDGLNEASGDTTWLLQEINDLARFPGVKIVLTGRANACLPDYTHYSLCPLEDAAVKDILSENGILPPESESLFAVLKTPMMLSLFVQTVKNSEKQLFIESEKDLLSYYLDSLVKKQTSNLSEDAGEYWTIDAAVYYVLPYLAKLLASKNRTVSEQELFSEVTRRYRDLKRKKRDLKRQYPRWIGHIHAIRGNCSTADEWYGLIVHDILWKKLGLFVREEAGTDSTGYSYRLVHQILEEYMIDLCRDIDRAFIKIRRRRLAIPFAAGVLLLGLQLRYDYLSDLRQIVFQEKQPYDKTLADQVVSQETTVYVMQLKQQEALSALLGQLENGGTYDGTFETSLLKAFQNASQQSGVIARYPFDEVVANLTLTGDVMPWSGKALDSTALDRYLSFFQARTADYSNNVSRLEAVWQNDSIREKYGEECVHTFSAALDADMKLNLIFFDVLIQPELDGMKESDPDSWTQYQELLKKYWEYKTSQEIPDVNEVEMGEIADSAWAEFERSITTAEYLLENGE